MKFNFFFPMLQENQIALNNIYNWYSYVSIKNKSKPRTFFNLNKMF